MLVVPLEADIPSFDAKRRLWVNSAVLSVSPPLPVFPDKGTFGSLISFPSLVGAACQFGCEPASARAR